MNFDWARYNRFFTFGCSFTNYMWPTWADIVSKEIPNARFYNFGLSGSGNPLISYRIAEANSRFKFTDTDLVMVMFTSYTREDRWVEDRWLRDGNVYVSRRYGDDWLKKFANEKGYLIRDAAVINLTMTYLDSLPSDKYCMLSTPFLTNGEMYDDTSFPPTDILDVYNDTFSRFKPSLAETVFRNEYLNDDYKFKDGHPSTIRYYNYLNKIGFNLSQETTKYAIESSELLKTVLDRNALSLYFPEQEIRTSESYKLLF
jgi:hypothetical protein